MIWKFSISFNRAYKKFSDLKIKISSKKWNFKFPRTHVFVNVVIKVEVPFEICCSKISLRRKKNRRIINSDGELIIKILQNPSFPWWLQISRFLPVYNRLNFFFFFFHRGIPIHLEKPYLPQLLQLFRHPPPRIYPSVKRELRLICIVSRWVYCRHVGAFSTKN